MKRFVVVYSDNCSTWLFQIKHIIYNVYLLLSLIERLLEILKLELKTNFIVFEEFPVSVRDLTLANEVLLCKAVCFIPMQNCWIVWEICLSILNETDWHKPSSELFEEWAIVLIDWLNSCLPQNFTCVYTNILKI